MVETRKPTRFWFDTEFIEDGKTIDLISIGIVAEDGRGYYAEVEECDLSRAVPWVQENVIPHLTGQQKPREQIAREIVAFVGDTPEFWAYYADYDWVALCQLFGRMIDLPAGWPKFCRDVKQLAVALGNPKLPEQTSTEHHALADALWTHQAWGFLIAAEREQADARVAAAREKVAAWMVLRGFATGHGDTLDDLLAEAAWQVEELRMRREATRAAARKEALEEAGAGGG